MREVIIHAAILCHLFPDCSLCFHLNSEGLCYYQNNKTLFTKNCHECNIDGTFMTHSKGVRLVWFSGMCFLFSAPIYPCIILLWATRTCLKIQLHIRAAAVPVSTANEIAFTSVVLGWNQSSQRQSSLIPLKSNKKKRQKESCRYFCCSAGFQTF